MFHKRLLDAISPLQGSPPERGRILEPRPLAWALSCRPFGAQLGTIGIARPVEIDNPVVETARAADLYSQLSAAHGAPHPLFGISLVVSELPNALGWDAHGPSIAGMSYRGE